MSLRKAYQDMIKIQGVPDTAVLLEMSEDALDNRVQERRGQAFTVRQSLRMQKISGLTRFAEEIARQSGGTFNKLPCVGHIENQDVINKFMELQSELGLLSKRYREYTADDVLNPREKRDLSRLVDEMHRTLDELRALTFRLFTPEEEQASSES